ncbi:hypothetical protein Syun_003456 [Stephania yunnanensis]|uniref:Uncharacterized protein n=1 Tax=Stephania yunnanensis TaxID=152371 RepID=A0AAP0L544_9MAGN
MRADQIRIHNVNAAATTKSCNGGAWVELVCKGGGSGGFAGGSGVGRRATVGAARESAPAIGGVCSSTAKWRRGRAAKREAVTREVNEEIGRTRAKQRRSSASGGGEKGADGWMQR